MSKGYNFIEYYDAKILRYEMQKCYFLLRDKN